jgi:hypothetical protein
MKIYWINWISLNRKVKTNTEFGAVGRTDQEICREKARQLADKLDKLSEKQDKRRTKRKLCCKTESINSDFEKFRKNKDLDKDNGELKSPVDVPNDAGLKKV